MDVDANHAISKRGSVEHPFLKSQQIVGGHELFLLSLPMCIVS